jgi:hypothetical protein
MFFYVNVIGLLLFRYYFEKYIFFYEANLCLSYFSGNIFIKLSNFNKTLFL